MTIKEKLCEPLGKFYLETSKELEEIADNYAIEFAEWVRDNCWNIGKDRFLYQEEIFRFKELLQIFKKEKGL